MNDEKLACIYREYRKLALETAYDVLGDFHLAQDVCQEVFIKMSEKRLESFESSHQIKKYIRITAYHRAVDYYNMQVKRKEVCFGEETAHLTVPDSSEMMMYKLLREKMFEALWKKSKRWYMIVLRVGIYEEPKAVVARDLGMTTNLLRTKYCRAKQWIFKHYREEYDLLAK